VRMLDLTDCVGQWRGGRDGLVGDVVGCLSGEENQAVSTSSAGVGG
jgi:hypothetical protein